MKTFLYFCAFLALHEFTSATDILRPNSTSITIIRNSTVSNLKIFNETVANTNLSSPTFHSTIDNVVKDLEPSRLSKNTTEPFSSHTVRPKNPLILKRKTFADDKHPLKPPKIPNYHIQKNAINFNFSSRIAPTKHLSPLNPRKNFDLSSRIHRNFSHLSSHNETNRENGNSARHWGPLKPLPKIHLKPVNSTGPIAPVTQNPFDDSRNFGIQVTTISPYGNKEHSLVNDFVKQQKDRLFWDAMFNDSNDGKKSNDQFQQHYNPQPMPQTFFPASPVSYPRSSTSHSTRRRFH